jgi:hypothetical protein
MQGLENRCGFFREIWLTNEIGRLNLSSGARKPENVF